MAHNVATTFVLLPLKGGIPITEKRHKVIFITKKCPSLCSVEQQRCSHFGIADVLESYTIIPLNTEGSDCHRQRESLNAAGYVFQVSDT